MEWGIFKMGEILERTKGFLGVAILTPLAGAAMGTIGGVSALSSGVRGATQVAIGGGLLGASADLLKLR